MRISKKMKNWIDDNIEQIKSYTDETPEDWLRERIRFYKENWKAWKIEVPCNIDNILYNLECDIEGV